MLMYMEKIRDGPAVFYRSIGYQLYQVTIDSIREYSCLGSYIYTSFVAQGALVSLFEIVDERNQTRREMFSFFALFSAQ